MQRCRRQKFRVKANSGMAGTPKVFIIFQIVAIVFVSLKLGGGNYLGKFIYQKILPQFMAKKPITITLDTSTIDLNNPCLKILTEMAERDIIEIYTDGYQFIEKCNWRDVKKRNEVTEWIHRHTKTPIEAFPLAEGAEFPVEVNSILKKEQEIELKVRKIHSQEVKSLEFCKLSKFVDFRILTQHIKNGRDYFVTNNSKDFINFGKEKDKRRKQFENEFQGIKIRMLNEEFIEELENKIKYF